MPYTSIYGILSILLWLAAWALACRWPRRWHHMQRLALAVGLAVLALGLARVNSDVVSSIGVDRSAEEAAARERQKAMREQAEAEKGKVGGETMLFAEEAAVDVRDEAGRSEADDSGDDSGEYGAAAPAGEETAVATGDEEPAYRRGGKKQRAEGKQGAGKEAVKSVAKTVTAAKVGKQLVESEKIAADRFDRLNLFVSRWSLAILLLLSVGLYLLEYCLTVAHILPLPIAGRWLRALGDRSQVVRLQAGDGMWVRALLRHFVARGETYIYIGEMAADDSGRIWLGRGDSAWRDRASSLVRWLQADGVQDGGMALPRPLRAAVDRLAAAYLPTVTVHWLQLQRCTRAVLRRLPLALLAFGVLTLPLLIFCRFIDDTAWTYIVYVGIASALLLCVDTRFSRPVHYTRLQSPPPQPQAAFSAAWAGRNCLLLAPAAADAATVAALCRFLDDRRRTRATAPYGLNIIWDLGERDLSQVQALAAACRGVNCRLVVREPAEAALELDVDEVIDAAAHG
jgi:hypothetical protein